MSNGEPHRTRSPLRGLLIAQFFGAFNDNAWKLMVALLAIRQLSSQMGAGPEFEAASQAQTTLTFVVFTLPLMLVSIFAGVFSDRFSKRSVIVVMKVVEVVLMGFGDIGPLPQSFRRRPAAHRVGRYGRPKRALQSGQIRHSAGIASSRTIGHGERSTGIVDLPGHYRRDGDRRHSASDVGFLSLAGRSRVASVFGRGSCRFPVGTCGPACS